MSQETKRTFSIFFNVNCESEYVIYLTECILCKNKYVGKAETIFNVRLNNHRKDTKNLEQGHNLHKHTKYNIIEKLVNLCGSKEKL